jgi:predicted AAA+ superfamily ATPase
MIKIPTILYKREIVDQISKYIFTDDIIVLHGARQVGKTYILYYLAKIIEDKGEQAHFIDLEDSRLREIIDKGVPAFISYLKEEGLFSLKKIFIFIDEIQYLEDPSSFLKIIADHHKNIKLIVSGSSSFNIKTKFKDSLVGRTVNFNIFNLSFGEFLLFKNYYVDFKEIYTEKKISELIMFYEEYIKYGGYPKVVLTPEIEIKSKYINQIIDTYIKKDIRDLAEVKEIDKFNRLLEVLASQSGQLLNITELSNIVNLSKITLEKYLFLLEETYIIKLVRPFSKNKRKELFKTPKVFLFDTGLLNILWFKEFPKEILGSVFETSIFGELIKKYGINNVYFWRTSDKKEIDFILKDKNTPVPIEVKLNFAKVDILAMKYFSSEYSVDNYKTVALYGEKKDKPNTVYPWEI